LANSGKTVRQEKRLVFTLFPQRGRSLFALYWSAISLVVVALDYVSGPVIQFPAVFIIPVSLAAWYNGVAWGLALSVVLPLVRLYFTTILDAPWSFTEAAINAGIRIAVLGLFAVLVDRVAIQSAALNKRVKILEGMLPVCAVCKRVRDEHETWHPLEDYLRSQSKHQIRHDVCPDCAARYAPMLDRR
jgi:hypothetical protein